MDRPDPRRWEAMPSMKAMRKRGSPAAQVPRAATLLLLALVAAMTAPAAASQPAEVIFLPGGQLGRGHRRRR
jgi:hypothetical protein